MSKSESKQAFFNSGKNAELKVGDSGLSTEMEERMAVLGGNRLRSRKRKKIMMDTSSSSREIDLSHLTPQQYAITSNALDEVLDRYLPADPRTVGMLRFQLETEAEKKRDIVEIKNGENTFEGPKGDELTAKHFGLAAKIIDNLQADPEVKPLEQKKIYWLLKDREAKLARQPKKAPTGEILLDRHTHATTLRRQYLSIVTGSQPLEPMDYIQYIGIKHKKVKKIVHRLIDEPIIRSKVEREKREHLRTIAQEIYMSGGPVELSDTSLRENGYRDFVDKVQREYPGGIGALYHDTLLKNSS